MIWARIIATALVAMSLVTMGLGASAQEDARAETRLDTSGIPSCAREAMGAATTAPAIIRVLQRASFDGGPLGEPGIHTVLRARVLAAASGPSDVDVDVWTAGGRLGRFVRVVGDSQLPAVGQTWLVGTEMHDGVRWLSAHTCTRYAIGDSPELHAEAHRIVGLARALEDGGRR